MPAKKTTMTKKSQSSAKGKATAPAKTAAKTAAKSSAKSPARTAAKSSGRGAAQSKQTATSTRSGSTRSGDRLIDHAAIQAWAEERGAHPACVRETGGKGDVGMIRLDFPGYSGEESLQPIAWDEWFQKFDENNLALIVQKTTARGQKSNFNKLVKRTAEEMRPRARGAH